MTRGANGVFVTHMTALEPQQLETAPTDKSQANPRAPIDVLKGIGRRMGRPLTAKVRRRMLAACL